MAPNRKQQRNDNHHGHGGARPPTTAPIPEDHPGCRAVRGCPIPSPNQCLAQDLPLTEDGSNELVKVICNNPICNQGSFLHKVCFESWQEVTLNYLRNCGRARSWSEKQRLQNVWSKKGYDLVISVCGCNCGRGHLRKDLDYIPPRRPELDVPLPAPGGQGQNGGNAVGAVAGAQAQPVANAGKKKKTKTREPRPTLAISAPVPHPNNNHAPNRGSIDSSASGSCKGHAPVFGSCGSSSSGSFDLSTSPPGCSSGAGLMSRPRMDSMSSNISGGSSSSSDNSPPSPSTLALAMFKLPKKNSKECPDRSRLENVVCHAPVAIRNFLRDSGIFAKRMDFSSFNRLPSHKVNPYHIKMEEETHGSDDTRNFVLQTFMMARMNHINCILCHGKLAIFDRYPLIDGTFFMSPRKHGDTSIEISNPDGRTQYLTAVCMGCLEGWYCKLFCRHCRQGWDGADLLLGTCYTYDIFAATPCCRGRLSCSRCHGLLMLPEQRPLFFSEYSRSFCCPHCGLVDFHLAKTLPEMFDKSDRVQPINH